MMYRTSKVVCPDGKIRTAEFRSSRQPDRARVSVMIDGEQYKVAGTVISGAFIPDASRDRRDWAYTF